MKQQKLDDRVARILGDLSPEMKRASDFPELRTRVKVLLDGEDVTRLCRGFSVPAQKVELFVKEDDRHVFEWSCGCGTARGSRRLFAEHGKGRYCVICNQEFDGPRIAIDIRRGKVEVQQVTGVSMKLSPGDYLAEYVDSPLTVRLSRIWFTLRLWWPLLCRRPILAGRDLLPILRRMARRRTA